MSRRPFQHIDLLWLGLIVAAVAAPWLMSDLRAEIATDSFRTGPRGKKAIFLVADRLEYVVSRSFQPLTSRRWPLFQTSPWRSAKPMLQQSRAVPSMKWAAYSSTS